MHKHLLSLLTHRLSKEIIFIKFLFLLPMVTQAQITATTSNNYFSVSGFQNFEMPTATDVVLIGANPFQVVVSTTPTPVLHWDNNVGSTGSVTITGFSGTIFLDDVILARSSSGAYVTAIIGARVMLSNNTTDIVLIKAQWNGSSFGSISSNTIDTRTSNTDWFDRVSLAKVKYNGLIGTTQGVAAVWQKNGEIKMNQGIYDYTTTNFSWYNFKYDVFPGLSGTLKHPDISMSMKAYVHYWDPINLYNQGNIVAIQTNGSTQSIVSFSFSSLETGGVPVPDYTPAFKTYYSTSSASEEYRTPKILMCFNSGGAPGYGNMLTFNKLDNTNKKSFVLLASVDILTPLLFNLNQNLETSCSSNYNYKYTGFPSIAMIQTSHPYSLWFTEDIEVVWQQVDCSGSNFCGINAISKRYNFDVNTGWTPLNSNQYLYISSDITKNTVFPSIAATAVFSTPPNNTYCQNFYSFGIMDKITNANGQVGYKKTSCNGGTLFTGENFYNTEMIAGNGGMGKNKNIHADLKDQGTNDKDPVIYPNPARNILKIEAKNGEGMNKIEIYNATGNLLKRIDFSMSQQKDIKVSDLANGYYYLKIYAINNRVATKKIMIIH